MKKTTLLYLAIVLVLAVGLILFFLMHKPTMSQPMLFDQTSGVKFSIPNNMVKDNNQNALGECDSFDYVGTEYNDNALIHKSNEIITLRLKDTTHYCIKVGFYMSQNEVSENICAKSYPDLDYDQDPPIMQKILINQKPFVYLNGMDGAAGTAYGASLYRGMVNKKCLLIDVYYKEPDPGNYADNPAEAAKLENQFDKDYAQVNNLVKSIKFK